MKVSRDISAEINRLHRPTGSGQVRGLPTLLLRLFLAIGFTVAHVSAYSCDPVIDRYPYTKGCKWNSYKDQCPDVDCFADQGRRSCECKEDPGYFFVCSNDCDKYNFRKDGFCAQCSAGQYFDVSWLQAYNSCKPCPSGTFSVRGASNMYKRDPHKNFLKCEECPLGHYAGEEGQANQCNACPAGQYQDQTGQTSCLVCAAGTHRSEMAGSKCDACPPGSYTELPGMSSCSPCPSGTWTNTANTDYDCNPTPPGFYASGIGSAQDYPYPHGSYSISVNSTSCTSCEIGKSTLQVGSTSASDCVECRYGVDP